MTDKHIYDIWLQRVLTVRSTHIKALMTLFGSSENIYHADERSLRISGVLNRSELLRALNKDLTEAQRIYRLSIDNGIAVLSYTDEQYPDILRQIPDPPLVLFVKGTLPPLTGLKVAIVGTRQPSTVGRQTAFSFAHTLTQQKALIVSGGAVGVDTQAHKGALQAGGMTICVLGHGILFHYANGNDSLRSEIVLHGALVSEYPPDSSIQRYSFSNRNRLITALSDCTLVIEAGANSGSLVTAAYAAEQNKPLFAVPGSLDNPQAIGTNNLLRMGAVMTLQSSDLIDWYETGLRTADAIGQKMSGEDIKNARKLTEPMPLVYINHSLGNFVPTTDIADLIEDTPTSPSALLPFSMPEAVTAVPSIPKEVTAVPSILKEVTVVPSIPQKATVAPSIPKKVTAVPSVPETAVPSVSSVSKNTTASVHDTPSPDISWSDRPSETVKKPSSTQKAPASITGVSGDMPASPKLDNKKISDNQLTEGALSVYDTISESPTDVQAIQTATGMKVQHILAALTELELFGLIRPVSFGKYIRI